MHIRLDSLKKVYVAEIKDLYSATKQLMDFGTRLKDRAQADRLAGELGRLLDMEAVQLERLEQTIETFDYSASGERCRGMEGLIHEAKDLFKDREIPGEVLDVIIITWVQKALHYAIAGYGTARYLARLLGAEEAALTLSESLEELKRSDGRFNELASTVNVEALVSTS